MRTLATASRAKRIDALLALALTGAGGGSSDGPFVVARPKDGVTDDWPAFMGPGGVVQTAAANGQAVIMMPGLFGEPWVCKTPNLQMPAEVTIIGTPRTVINQTLNPAGGALAAAFNASATLGAPVGFAATNTVGSNIIHVLAGTYVPNVTQILATAANGVQAERFTVVAVSGTAPDIQLQLDRPALISLGGVGSTVQVVTNDKTNIRIFGNGMSMSGTGNSFVHFLNVSECCISDLELTGDTTNLLTGVVMDIGSYNNDVEQIDVSGCHAGISVIASELSRVTDCYVNGTATNAFDASDSIQAAFTNCSGTSSAKGILFDGSPGNTQGAILATVQGGSFNGNVIGIAMQGGSNRNTVIGSLCAGNTTAGCQVQPSGGSTPADNTFSEVSCVNNPLNGFVVTGSPIQVERTIFIGCKADGNGAGGGANLTLSANTKWIGLASRFTNATPANQVNVNVTAGDHKFDGCHVQNGSTAGIGFNASGGRVAVSSTEVTLDGPNSSGFNLTGTAELALANVALDGVGAAPNGVVGATGTTTWIGPNIQFQAVASTNSYNITQPGAFLSQSFGAGVVTAAPPPLTANGTTPVGVNFPLLKFGNQVVLVRSGGTIGAGVSIGRVIPTFSSGFTYVGTDASDLGVYDWRILE